jgi:Ras-related protein Rab-11A
MNRGVNTEEAKAYATQANMLFFETSAYDATNVCHAFETMFEHVYKELSKKKLLKKNEKANHISVGNKTVTLRPPSATYEYNHRHKSLANKEEESGGGCC